MRPGQNQQNRRMRGRNRNNKGPNPLTRSYDSNGPDVKIRGTAQHIADKYSQLARDAQVSGDPVAAENYFQHAEHYYRIIAAAQEQFRPAFNGYQRPYDDDGEEGDDEVGAPGYGPGERGGQDRFAERPAQGYNGGGGAADNDFGSQPQPYEGRGPRFDRGRQERGDRFERGEGRGERFERGDRRERFPRDEQGGRPRGEFQPRGDQPARTEGPRGEPAGPEPSGREDAPPREREFPRRERPAREETDLPAPTGLPAFLTNPARPVLAVVDAPATEEPSFPGADETAEAGASETNGRYPRRRRRRRVDAPAGEDGDTAAE